MPRGFTLVALLLAAASASSASTIEYSWVGNNGFSGYFTVDQSAFSATSVFDPIFGGSQEYQFISNTDVTALFITDGTTTFDLGNIISTSGIWFSSGGNPPAYTDGAGYTAEDAFGDELSLNGSGMYIVSGGGNSYIASNGNFVPIIISEPGTIWLLSAGLPCVAYYARRKRWCG